MTQVLYEPLTKADLKALAAFIGAIADMPMDGEWTIGNLRLTIELES